jgi:hypothetical protein
MNGDELIAALQQLTPEQRKLDVIIETEDGDEVTPVRVVEGKAPQYDGLKFVGEIRALRFEWLT